MKKIIVFMLLLCLLKAHIFSQGNKLGRKDFILESDLILNSLKLNEFKNQLNSKTNNLRNPIKSLLDSIYYWDNDLTSMSWNLFRKSIFNYDKFEKPIEIVIYIKDFVTGRIRPFSKIQRLYDLEGKIIESKSLNWNTGQMQFQNQSKVEYRYLANGKGEQDIVYSWNDNIGQWENLIRYDYEYNSNGKLVSIKDFIWNSTIKNWSTDGRTDFLFNQKEQEESLVVLDWIEVSTSWDTITRFDREFYPNNLSSSEVRFSYINNKRQLDELITLAYDAKGNETFKLIEKYNETIPGLEPQSRITRVFDDKNNETVFKGFEWNKVLKNWDLILDEKYSYIYNSHNQITEILTSFYSDANSGYIIGNRDNYSYSDKEVASVRQDKQDSQIVRVYPNPFNNYLYLNELQAGSSLSIYDIEGKKIYFKLIGDGQENIELKDIDPGLYTLVVRSKIEKSIIKILKID